MILTNMFRLPRLMAPDKCEGGKAMRKIVAQHQGADKRVTISHLGRQRGVGLIEMMVALVIGSLAAIVMLQMFGLAEGRKRTLASGADSQTSAAVALYLLERNLRQGGYGIAPSIADFSEDGQPSSKPLKGQKPINGILMKCTKVDGQALGGRAYSDVDFSPAAIITTTDTLAKMGVSGSQALLVNFTGSNGILASGLKLNGSLSVLAPVDIPSNKRGAKLDVFLGFRVGDAMLYVPTTGGECTTGRVTNIMAANDGKSANFSWSNTGSTPSAGSLYNLGVQSRFVSQIYGVRGGALMSCNYASTTCFEDSHWVSVAPGIVALSAQYGIDSNFDGAIDSWSADEVKGTARVEVMAIRLALVARSSQYEKKTDFTASAPVWRKDVENSEDVSFSTSGFPTDWARYRYSVAQTVIPFRNMMWGQQQ